MIINPETDLWCLTDPVNTEVVVLGHTFPRVMYVKSRRVEAFSYVDGKLALVPVTDKWHVKWRVDSVGDFYHDLDLTGTDLEQYEQVQALLVAIKLSC